MMNVLSTVAFNVNLRRYITASASGVTAAVSFGVVTPSPSPPPSPGDADDEPLFSLFGRGLHSSTLQLNLSRF